MNPPEPRTEELIGLAQQGDRAAYDLIVRRFRDRSLAYAYSVLGDYQLAEDATQEAFISAYLDLMQLRDASAFPGWLRRIVNNQAINLLRGEKRGAGPLPEGFEAASSEAGPAEQAEGSEVGLAVREAIEKLPEDEAVVARLHFLEHETALAIAQRLGQPLGTVKSRLRRGRLRLQQGLLGLLDSRRKSDMKANSLIRKAATEEAIEQLRQERLTLLKVPTHAELERAAELLCAEGRLHRFLGETEKALALFAEGLSSPQLRQQPFLKARLKAEMGISYMRLAKYPQAEKALVAANAALRSAAGPSTLLPAILNGLGACAWGKGNFNRARKLFGQAVDESRRVRCAEQEATALNNLSLIDWKRGDLAGAIEGFKRCRTQWRKLGNRFGLAQTLVNVGIIEENLGRLGEAKQNYAKAMELARELRFVQLEAVVYSNMANLALGRGEPREALRHGEAAVELARRTGDLRSEAIAHENLALAHIGLGQWTAAQKAAEAGRKIAHKTSDRERSFSLDLVAVELTLAQGIHAGMATRLRALEKALTRRGYLAETARLQRLWAQAEQLAGQSASMRRRLRQALVTCRRQGNKIEEKRLLALEKSLARTQKPKTPQGKIR